MPGVRLFGKHREKRRAKNQWREDAVRRADPILTELREQAIALVMSEAIKRPKLLKSTIYIFTNCIYDIFINYLAKR